MTYLKRFRRKLGALLRLVLPLGVLTLAQGCSSRQPSPQDLADYEAIARITSYVACQEVGDSLKSDERVAIRGSLAIVLAGLSSGRLDGLDAALRELGVRDHGHRLLVEAALQLASGRIPDDVREHYATVITLAAVEGCAEGMGS